MSAYVFAILSSIAVPIVFVGMQIYFESKYKRPSQARKTAIAYAALLVLSALVGWSQILNNFEVMPPPFLAILLFNLVVPIWIVRSSFGGYLVALFPVSALITFQTFRILPEYLLHLAYTEGLAPIQMTWHGQNFEWLTVMLAPFFAIAAHRGYERISGVLFSVLGIVTLANIVGIAVLSAPVPFRFFTNEPQNTFVTIFPYIWLPTIHVFSAILGHALLIRKIWQMR